MSNSFDFNGFTVRRLIDFPDCCGAATLSGFGREYAAELSRAVAKEFTWFCTDYTDKRGLIAILSSEETDKEWPELLKEAGFTIVHRYTNYHTGNELCVWFRDPPVQEYEEYEGDY